MPFIEFEKSIRKTEWSMLELHSHEHYEIYFLSKGERTILLPDRLYRVTAPALIIYPPKFLHKTEGGAFERHIINVSPRYLNAFQTSILEDKKLRLIRLSAQESKTLLDLFDSAYKIKENDRFHYLRQNAVFTSILLEIDGLEDFGQNPQTEVAKPIPASVLKILDYFSSNFGEDFTLDDIADRFFISKTTLIYNFKKHVGRTPMDYLLAVRINKAKQMLISSKKSINEIAETCGFSSANYFGLIFKKKENVSPLKYRRIQNEKV